MPHTKPKNQLNLGHLIFAIGWILPSVVLGQQPCSSENQSYKNAERVCNDLKKTSDYANITLSVATASLNPIAFGAAAAAALSAAKAAAHNCKIKTDKENDLSHCIQVFEQSQKNLIAESLRQAEEVENRKGLMEFWENSNIQYENRLAGLIKSTQQQDHSRLLMPYELEKFSHQKIKDYYLDLKAAHRSLKNEVQAYEGQSTLGPIVISQWD